MEVCVLTVCGRALSYDVRFLFPNPAVSNPEAAKARLTCPIQAGGMVLPFQLGAFMCRKLVA